MPTHRRNRRRSSHWNLRFPECVNCGVTDRPRRTGGYCNVCWPHAKRIRQVADWEPDNPKTFKGAGLYQSPHVFLSPTAPREYAEAVVKRSKNALNNIRDWEAKNSGLEQISGLSLEYLMDSVGEAILGRRSRKIFHAYATTLDHTLDDDSKQLLHSMMTKLLLARRQPDVFALAMGDIIFRRPRRLNADRLE